LCVFIFPLEFSCFFLFLFIQGLSLSHGRQRRQWRRQERDIFGNSISFELRNSGDKQGDYSFFHHEPENLNSVVITLWNFNLILNERNFSRPIDPKWKKTHSQTFSFFNKRRKNLIKISTFITNFSDWFSLSIQSVYIFFLFKEQNSNYQRNSFEPKSDEKFGIFLFTDSLPQLNIPTEKIVPINERFSILIS
jgi:hypothetical protein